MTDERLDSEDWLREQYVGEKRGMRDIADQLGTSDSVVQGRLARHGIETRGSKWTDPRLDDPEWLEEKYHGERMTMGEIAEECSCSPRTVSRRIKTHGIDPRNPGTQHPMEEVQADVRGVADEVGGPPSISQYEELGAYSRDTVKRGHGSWADAIGAALAGVWEDE